MSIRNTAGPTAFARGGIGRAVLRVEQRLQKDALPVRLRHRHAVVRCRCHLRRVGDTVMGSRRGREARAEGQHAAASGAGGRRPPCARPCARAGAPRSRGAGQFGRGTQGANDVRRAALGRRGAARGPGGPRDLTCRGATPRLLAGRLVRPRRVCLGLPPYCPARVALGEDPASERQIYHLPPDFSPCHI